jgi:hypothetical protein
MAGVLTTYAIEMAIDVTILTSDGKRIIEEFRVNAEFAASNSAHAPEKHISPRMQAKLLDELLPAIREHAEAVQRNEERRLA